MAISPISSFNNNYRNLYFGENKKNTTALNKTNTEVSVSEKQQNNNLDTEIKELKKEHSKTRKALVAVSVASALLIGGLLIRNHFSAQKRKMNVETMKSKLKEAVEKLKSPDIDGWLAADILTDALIIL